MPNVPGWTTIANSNGSFGLEQQTPTEIDQETLTPAGGGGGGITTIQNTDGTVTVTNGSGPLTTLAAPGTELQTRPVSASAPSTGQALVWSGSSWAPGTAAGGVTEVTSSSLTVTDPEGPVTDIECTAASIAAAVTPGSSGNVLTSNGTTWQSIAPSGGTGAGIWAIDAVGQFGADNTGTVDAGAAINNAIFAASTSTLTRTVYLRPGTYLIDTGILLGYDYVSLVGASNAGAMQSGNGTTPVFSTGQGATVLQGGASLTAPVITVQNANTDQTIHFPAIERLHVVNGNTSVFNTGIQVFGVNGLKIYSSSVAGFTWGISVDMLPANLGVSSIWGDYFDILIATSTQSTNPTIPSGTTVLGADCGWAIGIGAYIQNAPFTNDVFANLFRHFTIVFQGAGQTQDGFHVGLADSGTIDEVSFLANGSVPSGSNTCFCWDYEVGSSAAGAGTIFHPSDYIVRRANMRLSETADAQANSPARNRGTVPLPSGGSAAQPNIMIENILENHGYERANLDNFIWLGSEPTPLWNSAAALSGQSSLSSAFQNLNPYPCICIVTAGSNAANVSQATASGTAIFTIPANTSSTFRLAYHDTLTQNSGNTASLNIVPSLSYT